MKPFSRIALNLAASLTALMCAAGAYANSWEGVPPHLEYGKRIASTQTLGALSEDVFGESTSLYNGATEFKVTDIELGGNNALRVHLSRRHLVQFQPQGSYSYDERYGGLGNWDIEVPYLTSTYPDSRHWPTNRCSGNPVPSVPAGFLLSEVWSGITVHLPGRGDSTVLAAGPSIAVPQVGGPYRYSTPERDVIDCIPMKSGLSGEGFRLTTAQGEKYYFDVAVTRTSSMLERQLRDGEGDTFTWRIKRTKFYLLASRVEDRHGNWVTYGYSSAGHPLAITSSDGRQIVLTYLNGVLTRATAAGDAWRYEYGAFGSLATVRRPDESVWTYNYVGGLNPSVQGADTLPPFPYCLQNQLMLDNGYGLTATHPSGLTGKFTFLNMRHYRSGVHANECYAYNLGTPEPDYVLVNPHYFDVVSLVAKEYSGPGLSNPLLWQYDYHWDNSGYAFTLWGSYGGSESYPCTTCTPSKYVMLTRPDGVRERYTYGMLYLVNEGRHLRTETLDLSGAVIRDEKLSYLPDAWESSQLFYPRYGGRLGLGELTPTLVRPVVERTIQQDGHVFRWGVRLGCGSAQAYCFDAFARPTTVDKTSSPAP